MALPIITVFRGDRPYLAHCIAQARASNPESEFILLGDRSTRYYRGVTHYNYSDYFVDAGRLAQVFRHERSFTTKECELFYFQRWLILNEFCKTHGVNACFIIDGDIMIYMELSSLMQLYPNVKMTICAAGGRPHGGSSFIFELEVLQKYCDLIFEYSANHEGFPGVLNNEMWVLGILQERYRDHIANACVPVDGTLMQCNHSECDGFEMEKSRLRQKLYWKDGTPWAVEVGSGRMLRLALLHCHGKNKNVMWRYVRPRNPLDVVIWVYNVCAFKILKYPKRLMNIVSGRTIYPKF